MPLPTSILTADGAAALVDQAALLAGVPRTAWDNASATLRQAALDAAWKVIASTPGYYLAEATADAAVHLAVTVEGLVQLDVQADAGSAVRARLQAQGVQETRVGPVQESYGRRPDLHRATRSLLAPYRGAVRFA